MSRAARTLRELVEAGAGELRWSEGAARHDPRREARLLLQAAVGIDRTQLLLRGDEAAPPHGEARYWEMVRRRARGLPLPLLVGETPFHDVTLGVEAGVFIPRPETERLVEEAVAELDRRLHRGRARECRVLDLCTGTGAVAVALAWRFRSERALRIWAGDWSPRAVRLARRNAERNAVRVEVRRSDLFSAFADLEGRLDLIVANPPYVAPEERDRLPVEVRLGDPHEALFDPEGGTGFHRRIAARGRDFLRPGGWLALEIGAEQGGDVRELLIELGYEEVLVRPDLAGRDRIACGRRPASTRSW